MRWKQEDIMQDLWDRNEVANRPVTHMVNALVCR